MLYISYLVIAVLLPTVVITLNEYLKHRNLGYIPGPSSPSFLFGHLLAITRQDEVGDLDTDCIKRYGGAWRLKEYFGTNTIWFVDPKALQHIFKSGYNYSRRTDGRQISRQLTGDGILAFDGPDHARIRRIMDPAFNTSQIRSFLPVFQQLSKKLSDKWREQLTKSSQADCVINVRSWFTRTTLDAIGEAAFNFDCGALDGDLHEVMEVYKTMFSDSMLHPSRFTLLYQALWRYLPTFVLPYVTYLPTKEYRRLRRSLNTINGFARDLIRERGDSVQNHDDNNKRDMMNILLKANMSENPKTRLNDKEMVSQMATFLLAGHETTAGTLTWLFWELAKDIKSQNRLREEISTARSKLTNAGRTSFSIADLDEMSYLNAVIKEAMRLHPLVYLLIREATRDDVIPLSVPIRTSKGELITEIPVRKGQDIGISVYGYQRLPEVWGSDANQWNPDRFLQSDKERKYPLGPYANLLGFGGGNRACLGWRFAVLEIQAVLVELLENFEFSIPDDKPQIQRVCGGVMIPMIRNKTHLGPQMPLTVSIIKH